MTFEPAYNSYRSATMGTKGMVATSQPLAVAAGLDILRQGGNAADAAVATAAALAVTEPCSTGIGGDCFALYYDAQTQQVSALNGSGRAPANLNLATLNAAGMQDAWTPFSVHSITVPGAAAGWCDTIDELGTLSLAEVLAPAIALAEDGFPVAPLTSYFWARGTERQLSKATNGEELTIDGRAPRKGERFRNPGMARTMRLLAEQGKAGYYEGEIADAIIAVIKQNGGVMTHADLAQHTSTWVDPIHTDYHGMRVWECPPNGQGLAALLALNLLSELDIASLAPLSTERLHLQIEAMRLAFADTAWYVTDPEYSNIPVPELLSKSYAAERVKLINPEKATIDQVRGAPVASSDTVLLSVVDQWGNACSFINSNYAGFGTGIVPKGFGFTLQNRGENFSLDPNHPNVVAPHKRPYHTIIPGMLTNAADNSLIGPFGVMGGFMQPQGHMQMVVNMADDGLDPQQALDQARFCIEDGTAGGQVGLEEGISLETMSKLARMGHPMRPVHGYGRALFGRGQIITRDADGIVTGGSDPRADGCAMPQ